jgi:protein-serine/threonine kinase
MADHLPVPPRPSAPPNSSNDLESPPHSLNSHPAASSAIAANQAAFQQNAPLPPIDTAHLPIVHIRHPSGITPTHSPISAALHLRTDAASSTMAQQLPTNSTDETPTAATSSAPVAIPQPSGNTYNIKSSLSAMSLTSNNSFSPGSALSSPALAAMTDITPLPSPFMPGESPGPWRRTVARPGSAGSLSSVREEVLAEQIPDELTPTRTSSTKKKKAHGSLMAQAIEASSGDTRMRENETSHSRNRSLSEFVPQQLHNVRPRNITITTTQPGSLGEAPRESDLQREKYLAEQRGIVPPPVPSSATLPTPPPSNRSTTESEGEELREEEPYVEYLTVRYGTKKRKRQYRPVRPLGQGTFSKVVLATDQPLPPKTVLNEASESSLDPKHLVAIKIVEHGPAGGADEERVALSLKREVELLRSVSHPSLVDLKAFDFDEREALLVLGYCPGGDLFDLASAHRDALTAPVVQRMFAELVDAVAYLHGQWIVHRDIKLENVLLNMPTAKLAQIESPATYPHPLVTLTDLGLSRHIPKPPTSPLLTTRCGSEDYAAPEILLSQPYDGRATDAWALGVLLYALVEGRLPFDAPPVRPGRKAARGRSKAAHRIARCEWMWCRFGDNFGDWDASLGVGWEGARDVVQKLLLKVSRGRLTVPELQGTIYVKEGMQVPGGLKREHDYSWDDGEEDARFAEVVDEKDLEGDITMEESVPGASPNDGDAADVR